MDLNAQKSVCWKCKHGMCIQEIQEEVIIPEHREDPFLHQEEDQARMLQVQGSKTICFWRPPDVRHSPPIVTGFVSNCSRFEKRNGI